MGNKTDDKTVDVVKPKSNKKYSKRLFLTVGVAALVALVFIANSVGSSGSRHNNASFVAEQEDLSPATMPMEITRATPYNISTTVREEQKPPAIIVKEEQSNLGYTVPPAEGTVEIDRNRQQWLDFEKSVFTSRPDVQGSWGNAIVSPQDARTDERETRATTEGLAANRAASAKEIDNMPTMSEKEKFLNASRSGKGYLDSTRSAPISPYVLPSGTVIPCTLLSGVNSDLPGNIVAQVTENVYDWVRHRAVLIPQGTKVFGVYDSNIAFAQKRVQVLWTRLIYPDGSVLDLQGMAGIDKQGYSGLRDKHYAHYGRMLTAAILTAAFSSVGLLFDDNTSGNTVATSSGTVVVQGDNKSAQQEVAKAIAESLGQMGQGFFNKALNVPPTILIRPGTRFNILCNADVPFYERWR